MVDDIYIAYLLSLITALCWGMSPLIMHSVLQQVGAVRAAQWRMIYVFIILSILVSINGAWDGFNIDEWHLYFLSGFVGIFLGDTALFESLRRLGPRRNTIIFSSNAAMTIIGAWIFLGEGLTYQALIGCITISVGVVIAIIYGKRADLIHKWETVTPPLMLGVFIALFAALCQAAGVLITKPLLLSGGDAVMVSAVRVGVAAISLIVWSMGKEIIKGMLGKTESPNNTQKLKNKLSFIMHHLSPFKNISYQAHMRIFTSGILAMGVGMPLLLYALKIGHAGMVATLSSTSPILILPLLWMITGRRPAAGAWIGAIIAGVGCGLIFL